ncbi:hypothetical protein ABTZ99_01425 [Actinosynnema sp. NPDC002837]
MEYLQDQGYSITQEMIRGCRDGAQGKVMNCENILVRADVTARHASAACELASKQ